MKTYLSMFVHDTKQEPYAEQIANVLKLIETRKRDMLRSMIGQRVLIIRTRSGHRPEVIGSVLVEGKAHCSSEWLNDHRHMTQIPEGSKYDSDVAGKWCYFLSGAKKLPDPIPLDSLNVIRKTRSWAEIALN